MSADPHPSEDVFERYCLGTLPVAEVEALEEHTLVCGECQDRLRETERYVKTMQSALAETRDAHLAPRRRRWMRSPAVWAGGVAALALGFVLVFYLHVGGNGAPFPVALELARGGEAALRARAPARQPLLLRLDLKGVPALASYQLRIVDERGREVFQAPAAPSGTSLTVRAPGRLGRGLYWVRVCGADSSGRVLREFALELE
jgi:hypothetical protein